MEMEYVLSILIPLLGGLGLFLYGMTVMSDGLEKAAGSRMEKIIEKMSGHILKGVAAGAIVTVVIQSSSATTVMIVGFVNAGIMNLTQAIGMIMGANIGTTITAQLVSLDVSALAPITIGVGVLLSMIAKTSKTRTIGEILIGFGILFLGMDWMKTAMEPLGENEAFEEMIKTFGDGTLIGAFKGFLVGLGLTALVQSSSATTSILIALASTGGLPIEAALPVLLGSNVGTCVTAMISSAGASKMAKRAALMHLMFNVIGTIVFAICFMNITETIVTKMSDDPERQLANAHTLFNVVNTLLLLPFAGLIVKLVQRILPITEEEQDDTDVIKLDERLLETPSIALGQAVKEVDNMGKLATKSLDNAILAIRDNEMKAALKTFKIEKNINRFQDELIAFLIKLSNASPISEDDRTIIDKLFSTVNDIERVADHADNIAELAVYKIENKFQFSDKAIDEIDEMTSKVRSGYVKSVESLRNNDIELAKDVLEIEGVVDEMEKTLRKTHIRRLNEGRCQTKAGIVFLDAISNLERVSDHASNIALSVLES